MEEGLIRTFGLTSTVTLGVAESYGEPTGVVVWDEDVHRHLRRHHALNLAKHPKYKKSPSKRQAGCPRLPTNDEGRTWSVRERETDRKSPCKADKAATKGKSPTNVSEEPPTSRRRPKSVRELCNVSVGVDGQDYHAIRMCNISEKAPDAPIEADLRPLTHGMLVWQNGEASTKYIRGTLILRLAIDLYTLPSEVLIYGAVKAMVLLLELARSKDALQEDLPRRAIEDYKKSFGFEMGLVRMGRVSLEYWYQLALARLQARHPRVEIELDPFVSLPEDDDVPMADEQPFDGSLPPPEE
ncbi:hypothetical protein BHM03_00014157 [Ensete ventricosum]|nr:hypothetical protein BHM03_00014157 [Ensete ventricosum]